MKKRYLLCLLLAALVLHTFTCATYAETNSNIVLSLSDDDFGIENIPNKEVSGPSSFFVTDDETIYVLDTLNNQILTCKNNSILNKISYDQSFYAIDIYVDKNRIYLLSVNSILIINENGATMEEIILPQIEENSYTYEIYDNKYKSYYNPQYIEVDNDSIYVTFQNLKKFKLHDNMLEKANQEYDVKLNNGKPYAKKSSLVNYFDVNADPVLISYLKKDSNDNHYIRLVEMGNTKSGTMLDDTVRIINNGEIVGVAQLQNNYLYQPNKTVFVTDNGIIYEMVVNEDRLTICKVKPNNKYISRIENIDTEDPMLNSTKDFKATGLDPYFVWKAIEAYVYEEDTYWIYNSTYNGNKNVTSNPSSVSQPHQLRSLNDGKDHDIVGIPYCWGGSDTPSSFQYKISRRTSPLYYAGNISSASSVYVGGTAGVDCSGFVCNVFDIPRLSTKDLLNCSYFDKIGDWKQGQQFDILLKSGHVMILNDYKIDNNGQVVGCYVWESTTRDGVDQVLANYHDATYAKDFQIYRFTDWQ